MNAPTLYFSLEPRWKTYLKASAFLAPPVFLWAILCVFAFPKLKQLWADAGFFDPTLVGFMQTSDFFIHHGVVLGVSMVALLSLFEWQTNSVSIQHLKSCSWLMGIVAAVCTSLVTFLGPIGKEERYWSAFHALDQACLEFEQGLIGVKRFVARVRGARTILQAGGATDEQLSDAFRDAERDAGGGAPPAVAEPKGAGA